MARTRRASSILDELRSIPRRKRNPSWFDKLKDEATRRDLMEVRRAFLSGELDGVSQADIHRWAAKKYGLTQNAITFCRFLRGETSHE